MNSVNEVNPFAGLGNTQSAGAVDNSEILQEDFLELMVTQLNNQDPFKPMESGEFLGQLAQFGTVSGIDNLENSFKELANSLTSNQALQASSLIDREVWLTTDRGALPGAGPMNAALELPAGAEQVRVGVYDDTGRLVRQLELGNQPGGQLEFSWDGMDAEGVRQPPGTYQLKAEASTGGVTQAVEITVIAKVAGVTLGRPGEPMNLEIDGLGTVELSKIKRIG
jgi:flagellar basal-body rod modification protein FlgD